jgi:hypothetical protein
VKWFKLGLENGDALMVPDGLTPQDVVRDYLAALYRHTIETLWRRFDRSVMSLTKVDFVVTVPAIWSDAAKKSAVDVPWTSFVC